MMKAFKRIAGAMMLIALASCQPKPETPNALQLDHHWQRFTTNFMDEDGRVIDIGSRGSITTSEGQSYALFFALVTNSQAHFETLLEWTETNLADGDLTANLPAWLWGQNEQGEWGVLDSNSASDADVILAYTLIQAGQLWEQPRYSALGRVLAAQILRKQSIRWQQRLFLLPGQIGFVKSDPDQLKLNLSYYAWPLIRGLAYATGDRRWQQLYTDSAYLLSLHSSGFASDWLTLNHDSELAAQQQAAADYDAIRAYYWLALDMQQETSEHPLNSLGGMVDAVAELGVPPAQVDWLTGEYTGTGPIGFSAALLPMLKALQPELAELQRQRILAIAPDHYAERYYDTMLLMFGLGADRQCFKFLESGALQTAWNRKECAGDN